MRVAAAQLCSCIRADDRACDPRKIGGWGGAAGGFLAARLQTWDWGGVGRISMKQEGWKDSAAGMRDIHPREATRGFPAAHDPLPQAISIPNRNHWHNDRTNQRHPREITKTIPTAISASSPTMIFFSEVSESIVSLGHASLCFASQRIFTTHEMQNYLSTIRRVLLLPLPVRELERSCAASTSYVDARRNLHVRVAKKSDYFAMLVIGLNHLSQWLRL